jgi:hypothetical protein
VFYLPVISIYIKFFTKIFFYVTPGLSNALVLKGQHHDHETLMPVEFIPKMEPITIAPVKLEPFTIPTFRLEPLTIPTLSMEPLKFNLSDIEAQIKKQVSDAISQSLVVKIEPFQFNASEIEEQIRTQMDLIANLSQPLKFEAFKVEIGPLVKKQIEDAVEAARKNFPVIDLSNLTAGSLDRTLEDFGTSFKKNADRAIDVISVFNSSFLGLTGFEARKQNVIEQINNGSEIIQSGLDSIRSLLSTLFNEKN